MLRRTAVQWIQSNDDQNWLVLMFVQMISLYINIDEEEKKDFSIADF